jgi:uncharacterized protein (DUF1499 family)
MSSERPALEPCPRTPNCVSTQAEDPAKRMDPIPFRGDLVASRQRLLDLLNSLPRVRIEESDETRVHAVFTTPLLRFRDDVVFAFDPEAEVIHFRSASRIGRSDWGTNRKRMEELTRLYEEHEPSD